MSRATLTRPDFTSPRHRRLPPPPVAVPARVTSGRANLRQAYDLAIMGGLGALFGLYLYVEMVQAESVYVRDALAGLLIGGSLGVFLNAYGPARDGAWLKMARAVTWGAPAAAIGGAIGLVAGEVVIGLLRGGLLGRALSWAVLGLGIGLGQGLADRSRERLVYGLIGGGLGGFVGGFLFEWLRSTFCGSHGREPGRRNRAPGRGLGFVPGLGRAGAETSMGSSSERPPGGAHLSAGASAMPAGPGRARRDRHLRRPGRRAPARRDRVELARLCLARPGRAGQHARQRSARSRANSVLQDGDRIELGHTLLVFRHR